MTIPCDNFPHYFYYQEAAGLYNLYSCNACFGFKITILIATSGNSNSCFKNMKFGFNNF